MAPRSTGHGASNGAGSSSSVGAVGGTVGSAADAMTMLPGSVVYPVNSVVWARVRSFPWWPARVVEAHEIYVKKGVQYTWCVSRGRGGDGPARDRFTADLRV